MMLTGENLSKRKETYPSDKMPIPNPTWTDLRLTGAPAVRRRRITASAMTRSPVIYSSMAYLITISIHVTLSATSCYRKKATSITHSECVFVALVIQHAMRMRQTAICGLPGYHAFPRYLINGTIFR
jgi:hypothetical protein